MRNGIIIFHPTIEELLSEAQMLIEQLKQSNMSPLVNVMIEGKPGTGKTALAATIAERSSFPFVKVLDAERLLGFPEHLRINEITKVTITELNSRKKKEKKKDFINFYILDIYGRFQITTFCYSSRRI